MNERQILWKQLQTFEKRGDLQKQAEILNQVMGARMPFQALPQTLKMAFERAQLELERNPPEIYRVILERSALQACNSRTGEVLREVNLPREAGLISPNDLNWSPQGSQQVMMLEVEQGKLKVVHSVEYLAPEQQGLLLNTSFSYLKLPPVRPQTSWFCRALYHPRIPLETVRTLPMDLFLSQRHQMLVVSDRGAGKVHLFQRDNLRLLRSWPILNAPNKKALNVCFHPDSKRIFVSGLQPGLVVMIDRMMAQKRLPLPNSHLIGGLATSNKGDLIYALAVNPETRRPDLWILDSEKFKQQQVVTLEGEAFSSGADARDLFELTPDGQYAIVMVSKNQPALFTPSLQLIELSSGKIIDQLALSPDNKPINLAFPTRELYSPRLRLLPMLIHGGYGVTEDMVKIAFEIENLE